jgi:hypothetical protein
MVGLLRNDQIIFAGEHQHLDVRQQSLQRLRQLGAGPYPSAAALRPDGRSSGTILVTDQTGASSSSLTRLTGRTVANDFENEIQGTLGWNPSGVAIESTGGIVVPLRSRGREATGFRVCQVDVASDNPAVRFYERKGMEILSDSRVLSLQKHGIASHYRMVKELYHLAWRRCGPRFPILRPFVGLKCTRRKADVIVGRRQASSSSIPSRCVRSVRFRFPGFRALDLTILCLCSDSSGESP